MGSVSNPENLRSAYYPRHMLLLTRVSRKHNVLGTDRTVSAQVSTLPSSPLLNPEQSIFDYIGRIIHLLQPLQHTQRSSEMGISPTIQNSRGPDSSSTYQDLESIWRLLSRRAGFKEESIPQLSGERLLQSSSQPFDKVVANLNNSS